MENEQSQKLVGMVTDRDLALTIVAAALDAKSTKVEAVMTRKVVTCRADVATRADQPEKTANIVVIDKDEFNKRVAEHEANQQKTNPGSPPTQ